MYCKHCGKMISNDSKFCQHCGGNQEYVISDQINISEQRENEKPISKGYNIDNNIDSSSSNPQKSSPQRIDYGDYDDNNATSKELLDFVITAIITAAIVVISFFALLLSLMYIHNFILGCVSSIIVGTIAYFLFKPKYFSEDSKHKRSPLYYTGLAISTLFILFLFYKFGEGVILSNINNPIHTSVDQKERVEKVLSLEEQYKSEIKIAKTKLPIVFDEYVSWTDIKRKPNGMLECDYLIDDANSDLYQIDLSKYKVELANKLKLISYKKYLELCMYAGHNLNCHLISKWDRSKSVDITFVNAEIGEILEKNSLKSN